MAFGEASVTDHPHTPPAGEPGHDEPPDLEALEALIEEARRRARRRRRLYGASAFSIAAAAFIGYFGFNNGGSTSSDALPGDPARSSAVHGSFGQLGGWIAYGGDDGILAVDPAQPNRRLWLSGRGRDPIAWSSDGTKLLIRRTSPGRLDGLFVVEADAIERRLTDGGDPSGGSFSPDGSEIVYADRVGRQRPAIYAQRLAGGAPRLILRSTRRVFFPDGHSAPAFVYQPALSPDGTRLAYFDGMYDHSHNLWVANADGRERRVVLDEEVSGAGHIRALTWAPNGEWLAFVTDESIHLVRPDGTGLRRVASSRVDTPGVQWSPDGSRIAYLRIGQTCTSGTGKDEDFTCEGTLSIANVDGSDEQVIEGIRTPMNSAIAWNPRG